ncbi:MAG: type II toxin-antitoxin system VapC family toxin [Candidatus Bipolaricaulota bacterium]|nr:type II toxin-antitoxin system VapC family toxin [Candidatus Bipolaricaulota bacterium]MDW8141197.1 type II toxin-antitoxin system VapC family toxin [Candidatus Bipolaricaulota bacterium]
METHYVVVDTDAVIDYFAGVSPTAEAVERLIREDRLALSTLTLFELACGAQTPDQLEDIELLAQAAHVIPLNAEAALRAGGIYRDLKTKGQLIGTADILIDACCLVEGLPLLTRNVEHFQRISQLKLVQAERF